MRSTQIVNPENRQPVSTIHGFDKLVQTCVPNGNRFFAHDLLLEHGNLYVEQSPLPAGNRTFKIHFCERYFTPRESWKVISNACYPLTGTWNSQSSRAAAPGERAVRDFSVLNLHELLRSYVKSNHSPKLQLLKVDLSYGNVRREFFFLVDAHQTHNVMTQVRRLTDGTPGMTLWELETCLMDFRSQAHMPRSSSQVTLAEEAAIAAAMEKLTPSRATKKDHAEEYFEKAAPSKSGTKMNSYNDDLYYDSDDFTPKKKSNNSTKEKKMATSSKKEKGISSTLTMAKRAATHGAKVAATDEIGETLLVFARELTGHDFTEKTDPVKNEVAKLVMATLLHAATENFDVPYGDGVASACELQIEASTRDVIQPRLSQLRPLFEQLARLGGAAVSGPAKAARAPKTPVEK